MPLLADPALVITFKRTPFLYFILQYECLTLFCAFFPVAGPFRDVTKETLFLTNTEAEPVLFKVKTTNPKQYCVRPASGFIEPNERKEITSAPFFINTFPHVCVPFHADVSDSSVMLQPLKDEPSPKSRDRFLIQSRSYPGANDSTNVNDAVRVPHLFIPIALIGPLCSGNRARQPSMSSASRSRLRPRIAPLLLRRPPPSPYALASTSCFC